MYEYLSLVYPLFIQFAHVCFMAYEKEHYQELIATIYKLVTIIKQISIQNRGGLIVLCDEDGDVTLFKMVSQ